MKGIPDGRNILISNKGKYYIELDFVKADNQLVGEDGSLWSCLMQGKKNGETGEWHKKKQTKSERRTVVNLILNDGTSKTFTVARLILEAFVGPCPEGLEACHYDGDCTNNALKNLRWDTHIENEKDKERHGTRLKGEKFWSAKLTIEQVREIRELYATGEWSMSELAREFNVAIGTVHPLIRRRTWKSVN